MSDYKLRMKQEYLELTTRISKLRRMIVMAKADKLDFKLSCKIELLMVIRLYFFFLRSSPKTRFFFIVSLYKLLFLSTQ